MRSKDKLMRSRASLTAIAAVGLAVILPLACARQPVIDVDKLVCQTSDNCPEGYRCSTSGNCVAVGKGGQDAATDGLAAGTGGAQAYGGAGGAMDVGGLGGIGVGGASSTAGIPGNGGAGPSDAAGGTSGGDGPIAAGGTTGTGGFTSAPLGSGGSAVTDVRSVDDRPPDVALRLDGPRDVVGTGGANGTGGAQGTGGSQGTGGATIPTAGPCDIYATDGGPCVAAHSTVRALYGAYSGPLYQVKKSDGTTADIGVLTRGGFADAAAQDAFCGSATCTISTIYDQSGRGNHLTKAPAGGVKPTPGNEANAKALLITIGGHNVYGEHNTAGVGYRNNLASGTATGDNPETIYMITSGDYYNGGCCFEYGNAETNNTANWEGSAEAIYFGNCTLWGKGSGSGPWVMGDLEMGLWAGSTSTNLANTSVSYKYVTAMVKGDSGNHWTIKAGNAQAGTLTTVFDGPRPNVKYNPMRKEGAIILGIGGDNSNVGQGNFFEGVITAHYSSDAADSAVQANIVAAGYGR